MAILRPPSRTLFFFRLALARFRSAHSGPEDIDARENLMSRKHQPTDDPENNVDESARVLTVNVGSSSIRFAFFTGGNPPERTLSGQVERIGLPGTVLHSRTAAGEANSRMFSSGECAGVTGSLLDWFESQAEFSSAAVVAHRVVHGGPKYREPQRVTPELLDELHRISPMDPDHLPAEIEMIHAIEQRFSHLPQVACFDTAFHAQMPRVARLLPIPRRYEAMGMQRYGFHGLSYTFLLEELRRLDGAPAANGRLILAHLGNGASMVAVKGSQPIDTSMAFTPAAGLPMSTRSGDLDPGIFPYLARTEAMTAEQFDDMVNHHSGLLGVSETSSDMRDLLAREADDTRAAEAVALFCYQARKWIGAYSAALGGLDTLVFSGGIGEYAPPVRARICEGLDFLGLHLDGELNTGNAPVISSADSRVAVRVIPTDEEIVLARAALTFAPTR
jgi:acetate kinase